MTRHGIRQESDDLAMGIDLGPQLRVLFEACLEGRPLLRVQGTENVRGRQIRPALLGTHEALRVRGNASRSFCMPSLRRVLTVPNGSVRCSAISRWVIPPK